MIIMLNLLEEFAYGNLSSCIQSPNKDPEYTQTLDITASLRQKLIDSLNSNDRELFERYADAQKELVELTAISNLAHGFKLGLIMTAEAFTGIDDIYS